MKCFEVDDEAEVRVVFAKTNDHARELFTVWSRLASGDDGENSTVTEMSRWLLRGPQVTLREDIDVGLKGGGVSLRRRLLAHLSGRLQTQLRLAAWCPRRCDCPLPGVTRLVVRKFDVLRLPSSIHPGRADRRRVAVRSPCHIL